MREEVLEKQFTELLGRLHFDDEVLDWVRNALHANHVDQLREHEDAIKRHQAEYKHLDDRIRTMCVDKLKGQASYSRIAEAFKSKGAAYVVSITRFHFEG